MARRKLDVFAEKFDIRDSWFDIHDSNALTPAPDRTRRPPLAPPCQGGEPKRLVAVLAKWNRRVAGIRPVLRPEMDDAWAARKQSSDTTGFMRS